MVLVSRLPFQGPFREEIDLKVNNKVMRIKLAAGVAEALAYGGLEVEVPPERTLKVPCADKHHKKCASGTSGAISAYFASATQRVWTPSWLIIQSLIFRGP